jgi:hypothetical protein
MANPKDSKIMVEMQRKLSSNLNYQLSKPESEQDRRQRNTMYEKLRGKTQNVQYPRS